MPVSDVLAGAAAFIRGLVPTLQSDVVAVLSGGFAPIFSLARPMAASVYERAEPMEHPLETGATVTDHLVFKPVQIEIPLICAGNFAYRATYAAIRATYLSGLRLTVQTRTGSYDNMVIAELPHDESAEYFDAITIRLRLVEARFVTPETELASNQVANSSQSSTVKRGSQQTAAPTAAAETAVTDGAAQSGGGSTLYRWTYGE